MTDKPTWLTYLNNTVAFFILSFLKPFFKPNKNGKNILFINNGQIGDLIISTVIFDNINLFKDKYEKVYLLVKNEFCNLAESFDGLSVIKWDYKRYKFNLFYRINFILNLRKLKFKDCYNLTAARGITVDELSILCGAKNIYALYSNYRYLKKLFGSKIDKMYNQILAAGIKNEYDKNIEVVKSINKKHTPIFNDNKVFSLIENNYKYDIAIAPFSSDTIKDWGIKNFEKLITYLSPKYRIILLGSIEQKNKLYSLKKESNNITLDAGETELNEIPNLIKCSKLFIGLDSGLSHIALKVGTPLLAIIGGGQFGRFFPYKESSNARYLFSKMDCFGCEWRCIHEKPYCLTEVSVDEVLKNVYELLHK